ncbi:MAG: hypothetical protein JF600_06415 [Xanthomonadales bacterium]|nr:hypothetical protein [Xanthomonadales bacterium]
MSVPPRLLLPAIALLCWATAAPAAATSADATVAEAPIPADLRPAVVRAEFLGRQLYLHDRAAWLATDAMRADARMTALMDRLGGWITEPSALGVRVVFYSRDDAPVSLYEVDVDEGERLFDAVVGSSAPLTDAQRAQVRARTLAQAQAFGHCGEDYNTAALASLDGFRVYRMPVFSRDRVYPMGGYQRYEIDATGQKILSSRGFTRSCLDLDENSKLDKAGKGFEPVMSQVSHLLDPQPTEIHVFVSLYARQPMRVVTTTNGLSWQVARGKIVLVDTPPVAPLDKPSPP